MRLVSLIPSGTDIVAALGLCKYLQGKSHACDHPCARDLPVLTHSVIDAALTPSQIDAAVSDALQTGDGGLYVTNRELLEELRPDLILTQAICDVCAVNENTARQIVPRGAQLLSLNATNFDGLWRDIENVARATNYQENGAQLIADCQNRLRIVRETVQNAPRPKVLVLEWSEPPFLAGHWVPQIIEFAGGDEVLGQQNQPSRRATWDEILASDPDIIILAPCGYDLEQTRAQGLELFENEPRFANLRAVRNGEVWATDATHLFSRCTPSSVRAVEVVASILHGQNSHTDAEAQRIF